MKRLLIYYFAASFLLFISFDVSYSESILIYADKDAWVDSSIPDETPSDNPFVSIYSSSNLQRWSYFKFDLSSIPNNAVISTAALKLYGSASWSTAPGFVTPYDRYPYFYYVDDDSWSDESINWDNKPAYGELLGMMYPGSAFSWSTLYFTYDGADNWDEYFDLEDDYLSIVGMIGDTLEYFSSYSAYSSLYGQSGPTLLLEYTVSEIPDPPQEVVPEPSSFILLSVALLGFFAVGRIKNF